MGSVVALCGATSTVEERGKRIRGLDGNTGLSLSYQTVSVRAEQNVLSSGFVNGKGRFLLS